MQAVSTPTTHNTVQTQLVEAAGVVFAYRRFGRPAEPPLVMLQHFRGNLDNWDPALTDALAAEREVILVDYTGVGSSTGEPSSTIAEMARQMIAIITALGLDRIDLLGFSIGGFVAQEIALVRPTLVRRLILAATGPKGAPGMHGWREEIAAAARGESKPENLPYIMFAHTDTSQGKGMEFLGRFMERQERRDAPTSDAARDAQYDAIVEWDIRDHAALQRLTGIQSPTLVIQGDDDLMIPTKLSHLMAGLIPDAQIRIYPDAAHGFLFQYPTEVAADVNAFLTPMTVDHERRRRRHEPDREQDLRSRARACTRARDGRQGQAREGVRKLGQGHRSPQWRRAGAVARAAAEGKSDGNELRDADVLPARVDSSGRQLL